MTGRLVIVVTAVLGLPNVVCAHSFAIYLSTPVSPPATFEWMLPVSLVAVCSAVFLALRLGAHLRLIETVIVSVATTLVFSGAFLFVGRFAASVHTGPPPGLGPPSAIYWHWQDYELGSLFAIWNIIGGVVLAVATFLCARLWRTDRNAKAIPILMLPLATYVLLLLPFLLSGAIAHGWAGGHVINAGKDRLYDVNRACFLYAAEHNGRFPVAATIDDLIPQIECFMTVTRSGYGNPITVYPAAWAFEKEPSPFAWDPAWSGQQAPELPIWDARQLPVQCPYIGEYARPLLDLKDRD